MANSFDSYPIQPIALEGDQEAFEVSDLVATVVNATDRQAGGMELKGDEARADFVLSSDALNYWRIIWRCKVEWGLPRLKSKFTQAFKGGICDKRGYDPDEFEAALEGTANRARLPFGWTTLDLAWELAKTEPLQLLDAKLAKSPGSAKIAAVAYQLKKIQKDSPILLPIDQLRALLVQRKIVVSGTVQRLIKAGIIEYADKSYHTGKAREFRFIGTEGEDFELLKPETPPVKKKGKSKDIETG